jgi:serine/threonine-protein kinase RsbW
VTGSDRTSGGQWTGSGAASPRTEGPACVCWPDQEGTGDQWVREVRGAEPTTVRALRRRMRTWVEAVELDEELAESVVLIVDEAVTNAVEHACSDRDCRVELVAGPRACGGGVAVLVADDGVWRDNQDPGYRGRGVTLMGRLSDRSSIETSEEGTTVRLCWASPRPAAH